MSDVTSKRGGNILKVFKCFREKIIEENGELTISVALCIVLLTLIAVVSFNYEKISKARGLSSVQQLTHRGNEVKSRPHSTLLIQFVLKNSQRDLLSLCCHLILSLNLETPH